MGSVIGMADDSGASTAAIKYDSFGNVTSEVGASAGINSTVGSDFRYHGMQLDAASGLYHVRARTYDARTGRFTSRDPVSGRVQGPESYQPYAYGQSNPPVYRDPSGLTATTLGELNIGLLGSTILATIALPSFQWALAAVGVGAVAVGTGLASNELNKPENQEKLKKHLEDLGKAIAVGTTIIQELSRGDRPYWGVFKTNTGLIPVTLPMPLEQAVGYVRQPRQDVWSRRGGTAIQVFPQGVAGPEIDRGGPGGADLPFPAGLRFCHYHPAGIKGGPLRTHSFFGPPHVSRIANDECLSY